jgi:hypothetical protein
MSEQFFYGECPACSWHPAKARKQLGLCAEDSGRDVWMTFRLRPMRTAEATTREKLPSNF